MYYGTRTGGRCCVCAGQTLRVQCTQRVAALFFVKWRHGRQVENPTLSVDAYPANFTMSRFDPIRLFCRGRPSYKNSKKNSKMSNDMRSLPDPKIRKENCVVFVLRSRVYPCVNLLITNEVQSVQKTTGRVSIGSPGSPILGLVSMFTMHFYSLLLNTVIANWFFSLLVSIIY